MRSTYLFRRKKSAPRAGKASICPQRLRCRPHRISRAHSRSRAETNAFQRRRIQPTTVGDRQTDDPAPRLCGEPAPPSLPCASNPPPDGLRVGCQVRSGLRAGGSRIRTIGPAEGARRPRGPRVAFAPPYVRWPELRAGDISRSRNLRIMRDRWFESGFLSGESGANSISGNLAMDAIPVKWGEMSKVSPCEVPATPCMVTEFNEQ
jgi:hypothetical protein